MPAVKAFLFVWLLLSWLLARQAGVTLDSFDFRDDKWKVCKALLLSAALIGMLLVANHLSTAHDIRIVGLFLWLAGGTLAALVWGGVLRSFLTVGVGLLVVWVISFFAIGIAATFIGPPGPFETLQWNATGTRILSNDGDAALTVWDPESGRMVRSFGTGGPAPASWAPDGQSLAFIDQTNSLLVWDLNTDSVNTIRAHVPTLATKLVWGPCGRYIAYGLAAGGIEILDVNSPDAAPKYLPGEGAVTDLTWRPDCRQLAAINSGRGGPAIWNLDPPERKDSLPFSLDNWFPLIRAF